MGRRLPPHLPVQRKADRPPVAALWAWAKRRGPWAWFGDAEGELEFTADEPGLEFDVIGVGALRIGKGEVRQFRFNFSNRTEIVEGQSLSGSPSGEVENTAKATVGTLAIASGQRVTAWITGVARGTTVAWIRCPTTVAPTVLAFPISVEVN